MLCVTEARAGVGCQASVSPLVVASSHDGVYGPSQLPRSGFLSTGQDWEVYGAGRSVQTVVLFEVGGERRLSMVGGEPAIHSWLGHFHAQFFFFGMVQGLDQGPWTHLTLFPLVKQSLRGS